MKRKEDLRVRKTKLNLYNGLLKLMEEKTFEDIRVTDICNKALVNRSTFYDHFNDKYELFQSYITYIGDIFNEKLKTVVESDNINDYFIEYLKILIDEIDSNFDIYKTVFSNNYNSVTINMLIDSSVNSVLKYLEANYEFENHSNVRLGVIFYVSGTVAVLTDNLKNTSNRLTKEQMIKLCNQLVPIFDKKKK